MKDEQVVGFSPEIQAMLETLRSRIGLILQGIPHALRFKPLEGCGTSTIDPRFDIIIGHVGIKDLSKADQPTKALPSSLPGTDQWPNVAKELNPEWITADFEMGGTPTPWQMFLQQHYPKGGQMQWTFEDLKSAFRAGYEEGRRAK